MAFSFEKLIVWQDAIELSGNIHDLTRSFPKEEIYGLISQMKRAVISYPSNIAEGAARSSRKKPIQAEHGILFQMTSLPRRF